MTNILVRWFFLIQEPRIIRLGMLAFYIATLLTGIAGFTASPDRFFTAAGPTVVYFCAGFLAFGGLIGAVAILPGYWAAEKIGIMSIAFGVVLRGVLVSSLSVSLMGSLFLLMLAILLLVRWVSIRRGDLAPISG